MSLLGETSANLLDAAASSDDFCKTLGKGELQLGWQWDSELNVSAVKENTFDIFYVLRFMG